MNMIARCSCILVYSKENSALCGTLTCSSSCCSSSNVTMHLLIELLFLVHVSTEKRGIRKSDSGQFSCTCLLEHDI